MFNRKLKQRIKELEDMISLDDVLFVIKNGKAYERLDDECKYTSWVTKDRLHSDVFFNKIHVLEKGCQVVYKHELDNIVKEESIKKLLKQKGVK